MMLRKSSVILLSALFVVTLTSCQRTDDKQDNKVNQVEDSAPVQKPSTERTELPSGANTTNTVQKERLISDLSFNENFWVHINLSQFTDPEQAYVIEDIDILANETTEQFDTFLITVHAQSSFATYIGNFNVSYSFDEDSEEWNLYGLQQDAEGTFEVIAYPTNDLMEAWYGTKFVEAIPLEDQLQGASVQEVEGRSYVCELQYDHAYQRDAHCKVRESLFYGCEFSNGVWNPTWQPSRPPETTYEYDLPPVSKQEIAEVLNTFIPEYVGQYDMVSGTEQPDANDITRTCVEGCMIDSSVFDTSEITFDLEMYCQVPDEDSISWELLLAHRDMFSDMSSYYKWTCTNISVMGTLPIGGSDGIEIDTTGDQNSTSKMLVIISPLQLDLETGLLYAKVTTSRAGETAERIMEFGDVGQNGSPRYGEKYCLYDNSLYIFFNENLDPVCYTRY